MNSQIIVVDDLYDIPHQYHKGFDENQCLITDETVGKISQILGNPVKVIQASNEVETTSGVMAHLECDWIAVIYMTLPLEAFGEMGIRFYSHLPTGLETFPTKEEIEKYQIEENEITKVFASDSKLWKEYSCIPAKYNRMVLFKGHRWHSYNLNSGIRYQKVIINNG
jgi:hypothetical protein